MRRRILHVAVAAGTGLGTAAIAHAAIDDVIVASSSGAGTIWRLDGSTLAEYASDAGFGSIRDLAVQSDDSVLVSNPTTVYRRNGATLDQHPTFPNAADFSAGNNPNLHGLAVRGDDSFALGDAGYLTNPARVGVIRMRSADTNASLANSPDDGFGQIVDVGVQSNGNMVVLSKGSGGAIYVRNGGDITSGPSSDSGFGDVTAMTITGDDYTLVGNSAGQLYLRNVNVSSGLASDSGFGNISALAALHTGDLAGKYVVVGNTVGDVYVRAGNITGGIASGNFGSAITAMTVQSDDDIVIGTADGTVRILRINGGSLNVLATSTNGANTFGAIADLAVQHVVPEPAGLAVLGLGAVLLANRRRGVGCR